MTEEKKPTYNMVCESGRFESGKFVESVVRYPQFGTGVGNVPLQPVYTVEEK
jgi:hypothetical protein